VKVEKDARGYDRVKWESVLNGWTETIDRIKIEKGWIYRYGKLGRDTNEYSICWVPE